jgi:RNA polymerase primary sigma factor
MPQSFWRMLEQSAGLYRYCWFPMGTTRQRSVSTSSVQEDALASYLSSIGRFPLLTASEEIELAKTIERGREARREGEKLAALHARTRFVECNLRLVVMLARRYSTGELDLIDVIQLGNIGLVKAVDKFDWRREFRFSTHASWWIRQSIGVGTEQSARVIRLPRQAREELAALYDAAERNSLQLRSVCAEELGKSSGLPSSRVRQILQFPREPLSIDRPRFDGEQALEDILADTSSPSTEEVALASASVGQVIEALCELPAVQQEIVRARFGLSSGKAQSQEQVSKKMGISCPTIRQLEKAALANLRELLSVETAGLAGVV